MRHIIALLIAAGGLATASACSTSATTETDNFSYHDSTVVVSPPLRLTATDQLAQTGILWALPSIASSPGKVTVRYTRYGSLCIYAVNGHAEVANGVVALTVVYNHRLTSCTAEIRSVTYNAEITVPAGTYAVVVAHEENNQRDILRTERVTVP